MFKNHTILLVEDNLDMQQYMKLLLEDDCKELFLAKDGVSGLKQYEENNPDVIITDLNMPVMNGIEMSQKIKMQNSLQPIILLTAYGNVNELQVAINIGLNAFISKPIENIEILFNTIKKVLNISTDIDQVREQQSQNEENVTNFVNEILHDDLEYIDYETLIKSVQK